MIVKQVISAQIKTVLVNTQGGELEEAQQRFCDQLAEVIVNSLLSAQVFIAPGAVITAGGPTSQTNAAPVIGKLQ